MKILYLCPDLGIPVLGRKGAAVHVRELIAAFERGGHQVLLAAQTLNKSPWEKPAALKTPPLQIRPASGSTAAAQALKEFNALLGVENSLPGELRRILYNKDLEAELKRRFENDPPDFIYERASLYATAGVSLKRSLNVPFVVELNAPLVTEQAAYRGSGFGELARHAERWTLTNADAVIVVSSPLREHVMGLGVPAERVHVVPNGVDLASFHPAARDGEMRRQLQLNNGPVLGFVGGLRPWHGVEILPALMERLAVRHDDLRLVIAGDGPLRGELERAFNERGVRANVIFTGLLSHDEIPAVIRQFDIALAPYKQPEHAFYFSPLKLFEYMACGVPVVAARLGQIAEVVHDEENGLLYPPGDLDALTACCERLLGNSKLRQDTGAAAAQLVQREFTWDRNAERIIALVSALKAEG
jgi:glycosyltransferase involved in cell wall biosynthesis